MALKYHQDRLDIRALKDNNIDRIQLAMIPPASRVLEIGCATGAMADYLARERDCTVLGVEAEGEQAERARQRGLEVLTGTTDEALVQAALDQDVAHHGPFQVVFLSQVIEHMPWPNKTLGQLRRWLTPDGLMVVSTCNIAHWSCRLRLLAGRFDYSDYGIMDRDHLRFFTIASCRRMLESCGYDILDIGFSFEDFCPVKLLCGTRLLAPSDILRLLPLVGKPLRRGYLNLARNLVATQFVFKATPRLTAAT